MDVNFDLAVEWVRDMGYDGPLALAVDDTKVTTALGTYRDGDVWKAGGMHGDVQVFKTYDDLLHMETELSKERLAEKVFFTYSLFLAN